MIYFERPEIAHPRFVLLLGPSGVGKSSIIRELRKQDDRVQFVAPIMDRPNREGEREKVSISRESFTDLENQGFFLVVNNLYGHRYGTPASSVDAMLQDGRIPILDFPLERVDKLEKYRALLLRVYIAPPSLEELRVRLNVDGRNEGGIRYEAGFRELTELANANFSHPNVDAVVINKSIEQASQETLTLIYHAIRP